MIVIDSGKMTIPESERFVGFAGDNLHAQKQFVVKNIADPDCVYRLYLNFDDGTTNYFVLDSKVENSSTLLTWNILTEHIFKSGIVNAQIKAFLADGEVFHTTWDYFYVEKSAESDEPFKDNENAEFLRYEKELNSILEKIEAGEYVPSNRKIANLELSSDISTKRLRSALECYPPILISGEPNNMTVGEEKQFCISDVNTTSCKLFLCIGQDENGDYIWKNLSALVSEETVKQVVSEYLDENMPEDGKSAYEVAVDNGFEGTQAQWLESLKGADGEDGIDGQDGVGISNITQGSNSSIDGGINTLEIALSDGTSTQFVVRNGSKGDTGETGPQGPQGEQGETGPQGDKGEKGDKGDTGANGADGYTPVKGTDYWTDDDKAQIISDVTNNENVGGRIDELYTIVEPLQNDSLNVFNCDDVTLDKARYFATGREVTETRDITGYYMYNGVISCKQGDVIRSNHSWYVQILVYDTDGVCVEVKSVDGTKMYTITSANAAFFTIQSSSQDNLSVLMITINNDMPSVYTPYTKNLVDKVNDLETEINNQKKYFDKPFVVLSFDAFNLTDNRFSIMNGEYGYKATVANTSSADTNKTVMKAGWDIGLYKLDNYPPDTLGYDVAVSSTPTQEVLDAWDSYVKTTIEDAQSYSVFNPTVWLTRQGCSCYGLETALKKYGIPMCRGNYSPDYSNDTQYSADGYPTMTVGCKQTLMPSTLEACQSAVADAVTGGYGVAFLTHGIYSTDDEANNSYGITEACLRSFLDTIKTYVDADKLEVLTYREVYRKYYPQNAKEYDYNRLLKLCFNSYES